MSMLRSIREKKGFTLGQLAGRAGISSKVLAEYEEGRQTITLAHAKLLAKALWVGIEDLIPPPGAIIPPRPAAAQAPPVSQASTPASPSMAPAPAASTAQTHTRTQPVSENSIVAGTAQIPGSSGTGAGEHKPQRAPRPSAAAASPVSEGQLQELVHLAMRLQIDNTRLEEQVGKSLHTLKKEEAKEWIKKLRGMADEIAPTTKVRYGQWPDAKEDLEAIYLREQKEAGAPFLFKLFNGETFTGIISDFTAYTITVKPPGKPPGKHNDEDVVLRKLAIAYYRRLPNGEASQGIKRPEQDKTEDAPDQPTHNHDHARDDRHQPLARGINSDRTGTPDIPEEDNMDKDRGA